MSIAALLNIHLRRLLELPHQVRDLAGQVRDLRVRVAMLGADLDRHQQEYPPAPEGFVAQAAFFSADTNDSVARGAIRAKSGWTPAWVAATGDYYPDLETAVAASRRYAELRATTGCASDAREIVDREFPPL